MRETENKGIILLFLRGFSQIHCPAVTQRNLGEYLESVASQTKIYKDYLWVGEEK